MKLLVTNDDGINSPFLHELVNALKSAGHELFVVAPLHEQSWTGASKTRHRPVKSRRLDDASDPTAAGVAHPPNFGCPAWTVDGTPSDCVNIALAHLLPSLSPATSVDGVVSGINVGFNCSLGFILASGTVAGAWEGALHGLPAMAFSQDISEKNYVHLKDRGGRPDAEMLATLRTSAAHAARLAGELLPRSTPRSFTVHNINFPFPCRADSRLEPTVPAQFFVPGLFSPAADDGTHRLIWSVGKDVSPPEPLTDLKCIAAGAISHTVLDYRKLGHT